MRSFCRKTHVHKIPRFGEGVFFGVGGGSADSIFMGARIFWFDKVSSLFFISLVFWVSLVFSLSGVSLVFRRFSPSFPGFSGVRQEQKILGIFWRFPWLSPKNQGKKVQGCLPLLSPINEFFCSFWACGCCECPNPLFQTWFFLGVRQRSGEGVVRRNGRPKGCFWRVRFLSAPLRFSCV